MPNLHLPTITCTLKRPTSFKLPPNTVLFEFPRHVNKIDIKNYLQAMYGIRVQKVNTCVPQVRRIPHPHPERFHTHPMMVPFVWTKMRKLAYVTIDAEFQMPAKSQLEKEKEERDERERLERREKTLDMIKLFRDRWQDVVQERYLGKEPVGNDPCPPLEKPLENKPLDICTLVQGAAKNRLHLDARGKARKAGKPRD